MDKVKEYAKSLATFVSTIAINMVISLLQGEQPWPQNQEEWIRYLGTAFVAALATAVPRNKMTQKQLDTAFEKGEVVAPTQVPVGTTPIVMTPEPEPPTSSGNATVDDILADYRAKHRAE